MTQSASQLWNSALSRLSAAMIEASTMVDPDADGAARDLATDRYVTAVDGLVDDLAELKKQGVLQCISDFLDKTGR